MDITVIICTFNRARVLAETLASFLEIERPEDLNVKLLVVDNASKDDTHDVVAQQRARFPDLVSYAREPRPGLSNARNTGIRLCTTELLAFVDDDVFFDRRWLVEIVAAFRRHPEAASVGGRSIPLFETGTPEWASERLMGIFGSTRSGDVPKRMVFPEHPFGLNMAFRAAVFDHIGGFDSRLGRTGSNLMSNEETELFHRVHEAGLAVFYAPSAVIHHRIPPARATKKWVLDRFYWQGVSDVAFECSTQPAISRVERLRRAKRSIESLWSHLGKLVWSKFSTDLDPAVRFAQAVQWRYQAGVVRGTFQALGSRPSRPPQSPE